MPSDPLAESGRGLFIVSRLAEELTILRRSNGGSHARVVLALDRTRTLALSARGYALYADETCV